MKKSKKDKGVLLSVLRRKYMKDPEFRKAHEALKPEFDLIRAEINARIKKGMTQAQIAKKAGTTQSAIARFEAGNTNPTLRFASRLSRAVGARLEIKLVK